MVHVKQHLLGQTLQLVFRVGDRSAALRTRSTARLRTSPHSLAFISISPMKVCCGLCDTKADKEQAQERIARLNMSRFNTKLHKNPTSVNQNEAASQGRTKHIHGN